jgi:threonylcarbamoyladenosine tRNA methylthiotransferase MtaB
MARAITSDQYAALVNRIREVVPEIALTTDILTGFPAETEEEFAESLDFIQLMNFANGHVFTYSAREGTLAAEFPDQIPHPVRKQRSALIRDLLAVSAAGYRKRFVGSDQTALWEQVEEGEDGSWKATGLTDNYLRIEAAASEDVWNTFSTVRIIGTTSKGVTGEIINY